jgi:Flp pilus assembly protein TadD
MVSFRPLRSLVLVASVWLAVASVVDLACAPSVPLPQRAIEMNAVGARALAAGDLSVAEASLSVALEYSPRFVEAWVNLGYVELRRGNFEEARRDLVKARDLNPDIPAPHHGLGLVADKRGRGAEAEEHYRAALAVDPGFAPARANLARRLYARGQYEDAREQFERLVQVAPGDPAAWAGRAEALIELGRRAEAAAVVAEGRERTGDAPVLMLLVARELLFRSEWSEAEAVLAPIVGSNDRMLAGAALAWMAVGRAATGDRAGAAQAAAAALAIDRDDAVAAYALRLASRGNGRQGSGAASPPGGGGKAASSPGTGNLPASFQGRSPDPGGGVMPGSIMAAGGGGAPLPAAGGGAGKASPGVGGVVPGTPFLLPGGDASLLPSGRPRPTPPAAGR